MIVMSNKEPIKLTNTGPPEIFEAQGPNETPVLEARRRGRKQGNLGV